MVNIARVRYLRHRILLEILDKGLTCREISERLSENYNSVASTLHRLKAAGKVKIVGEIPIGRGKPAGIYKADYFQALDDLLRKGVPHG